MNQKFQKRNKLDKNSEKTIILHFSRLHYIFHHPENEIQILKTLSISMYLLFPSIKQINQCNYSDSPVNPQNEIHWGMYSKTKKTPNSFPQKPIRNSSLLNSKKLHLIIDSASPEIQKQHALENQNKLHTQTTKKLHLNGKKKTITRRNQIEFESCISDSINLDSRSKRKIIQIYPPNPLNCRLMRLR